MTKYKTITLDGENYELHPIAKEEPEKDFNYYVTSYCSLELSHFDLASINTELWPNHLKIALIYYICKNDEGFDAGNLYYLLESMDDNFNIIHYQNEEVMSIFNFITSSCHDFFKSFER